MLRFSLPGDIMEKISERKMLMRFSYCPHCGSRLGSRSLGDEGLVPWCDSCDIPLFDMFSSCIIALVVNEYEEAAILRQNYLSSQYGTLVSGYMKPGESAEDCASREVMEELGIGLEELRIVKTWWHGRKDQLMIGFVGRAKKADFKLSSEVNEARWVPVAEALGQVHPKGSISYALIELYLYRKP